ncbi:hypothetical protein F511_36554 [Dorcoceras hygrometricum]|uniref:Uncharacterized protein n=1 Tax=Dorcoceras hygrometricum TaxID=472368 RepID=A0A2Z7AD39_9LAMI|nr:hypothetical protein F511_36554 [Dorcoceras hygrometricum]
MAASFNVNDLQVNFKSMLGMDHVGMVKMFKSLEESGVKVFLGVSGSVYEGALIEFFVSAKVITGTIVSTVANQKLVKTMDVFTEAFQLSTKGLVSFFELSAKSAAEMKALFFGTGVTFRPPIKKKDMKVEYRLLHDMVAMSLCAKSESFDVVTSEKLEMMVAISIGFKQAITKVRGVVEYNVVEAGEGRPWGVCSLASPKGLNNKFVLTYMKMNKVAAQAGETSKQSGDTTSENKFTVDGLQPLKNKPEQETIGEINWATHFLPKIDPASKGKQILEAFAWPNLVEEHCLQVPINFSQADFDAVLELKDVKRVVKSLDSKVYMVRDTQMYMKHDTAIFRIAFYKKIDEVVAIVNSSQMALEPSLFVNSQSTNNR